MLIEKGALASEECSAPDKRLLDQPPENVQSWKPVNFALMVKAQTDKSEVVGEERMQLVQYLLQQPDSLPSDESALHDCREKIQLHFPFLLPLYLRIEDEAMHKEVYAEAKALYCKV